MMAFLNSIPRCAHFCWAYTRTGILGQHIFGITEECVTEFGYIVVIDDG